MRASDDSRRSGVEVISWERFEQLVRILAEQVEGFEPQIILGLVRSGLFPATMLSFVLRREFSPIRLTRAGSRETSTWLIHPPDKVRGRRVLVVDTRVDAGRTIAVAADEVRRMGASHVRTAVLYAHTWAEVRPDYVAWTSNALILDPWDREVLIDGHWTTHPELAAKLRAHTERSTGPNPSMQPGGDTST